MFKMDDLRKDLVVMKCSNIIQNIFSQHEKLKQLPCVTYRVQPVTKSAGFIQLVDGETLSKVGSLKDYLLNKVTLGCRGTSVFIQSAAVASVLVYLFGIGDRHQDNLMVTSDGKFVNIDFGFLEGEDTMRCPYARIPDDVINYEDNKKVFFEWCKCVYLQLRRYAMHFHSLLMFLHTTEEDSEASLKKFEDFIQDRFCVECDEDLAIRKLEAFLEVSQNSTINTNVRDVTHKGKRVMVDAFYSLMNWWSGNSSVPEQPATPTSKNIVHEPIPSDVKSVLLRRGSKPASTTTVTANKRTLMTLDDSFSNAQQPRQQQQEDSVTKDDHDDDEDIDSSGVIIP